MVLWGLNEKDVYIFENVCYNKNVCGKVLGLRWRKFILKQIF